MSKFRRLKKPIDNEDTKNIFEQQVEKIKKIIEQGEEDNVSAEEVMIAIRDIIPEKIIYQDVEPQSSPEQLEYMKNWRLNQKRLEGIKNKTLLEQEKIKKALERPKAYCFNCKTMQEVINPSYDLIQKRGRTKKNIIVSFNCSNCGKIIKYFGGNI